MTPEYDPGETAGKAPKHPCRKRDLLFSRTREARVEDKPMLHAPASPAGSGRLHLPGEERPGGQDCRGHQPGTDLRPGVTQVQMDSIGRQEVLSHRTPKRPATAPAAAGSSRSRSRATGSGPARQWPARSPSTPGARPFNTITPAAAGWVVSCRFQPWPGKSGSNSRRQCAVAIRPAVILAAAPAAGCVG
jgi:hypothetical protein